MEKKKVESKVVQSAVRLAAGKAASWVEVRAVHSAVRLGWTRAAYLVEPRGAQTVEHLAGMKEVDLVVLSAG